MKIQASFMPLTKATHNLTEKEQPGPETVSAASVNLHSPVFSCTAELSSMQEQPMNTGKGNQTPSLSHA